MTPAADIYSLGVVLYELLLGEHPYRQRTVGATKKAYSYVYSFNGFAAELDAARPRR